MSRYLCHECMLRHPSFSFSSLTHGALSSDSNMGYKNLSHLARVARVFGKPFCLSLSGTNGCGAASPRARTNISAHFSIIFPKLRSMQAVSSLVSPIPRCLLCSFSSASRPRLFLIPRLPLARSDLLVLSCSMDPHQVPQKPCSVTCILEGDFCERGEKIRYHYPPSRH